MIYLNNNGKTYGPYSVLEYDQIVQNKQVPENTYYWKEGMSDWEMIPPLGEKIKDVKVDDNSGPLIRFSIPHAATEAAVIFLAVMVSLVLSFASVPFLLPSDAFILSIVIIFSIIFLAVGITVFYLKKIRKLKVINLYSTYFTVDQYSSRKYEIGMIKEIFIHNDFNAHRGERVLRKITVVFTTRKRMRIVWDGVFGADRELMIFYKTLIKLFADNLLCCTQPFELKMKKWVLNGEKLLTKKKNSPEVLLSDITYLSEFDQMIKLYKGTQAEPILSFSSHEKNIHVLAYLIRKLSKLEAQTNIIPEPHGYLLFKRQLLRCTIYFYTGAVVKRTNTKTNIIHYDEIEAIMVQRSRLYISLINKIDSYSVDIKTKSYSLSIPSEKRGADPDLHTIETMVSNRISHLMLQKIQEGESLLFENISLNQDGFVTKLNRFIGPDDESLISFSDKITYTIDDGVFTLFDNRSNKIFKVKLDVWNFYPLLSVFTTLFEQNKGSFTNRGNSIFGIKI